ncbi:MAG: carbamoyltransferase HypF [Bacteroidetes bacterium]|nr:MAG: carbamoyltransferase HypF [Bacteroidota bacterium]
MSTLSTFHIHYTGIVQGVGFRPFVYKLAKTKNLKGWVNNTVDGVHIEINATETQAQAFFQEVQDKAPGLSRIIHASMEEIPSQAFNDFDIIYSDDSGEPNLLMTPDFAMCQNCEKDLYDSQNKRHRYPFTTCTNCGPRFSIIKTLPYDRENTTMDVFQMCPDCQKEYNNPLDRRYYSQTNSCPVCTIEMQLESSSGEILSKDNETIIQSTIDLWNDGKIIAIKGIGGYLLTCDATNLEVIQRLRRVKNRPSKPFAIMHHDVLILSEDTDLDAGIMLEMQSPEAPIMLLKTNDDPLSGIKTADIAPGLGHIGVMLPYTPLYHLLLKAFGKPIIATSGNISNSPIVFEDHQAREELSQISDYILLNTRDIVAPQDDSVVRFSTIKFQKIILRRSRGMAPTYVNANLDLPDSPILAMGAMLKSTFTLLNQKNIYISQYLGDTDSFLTQQSFKHTLQHFLDILKTKPSVILADKHEGYFSTTYGQKLARELDVPIHKIQHHEAHFYAVMAENDLLNSSEKVMGVIWDGTGLGDDGNIWGGEFFEYTDNKVTRLDHLNYFDFILGDKMPKEPRVSALAICHSFEEGQELLQSKFTSTEWSIYQKLLAKGSRLKSSSIGRLFDAASSIVMDINKQTYEGEAAMLLEQQAYKYFRQNAPGMRISYLWEKELPENFTTFIMQFLIRDKKDGMEKPLLAAKFHITLIDYIKGMAAKYNHTKLAFSGGVFQNAWLVDLLLLFLGKNHDLYFHRELSPNDECVSFGQLVGYLKAIEE